MARQKNYRGAQGGKSIRVVRKLQFQNNFLIKKAKYRALDRYFAGLVRQLTELSNKSIDF
jgi:hypothetical protein